MLRPKVEVQGEVDRPPGTSPTNRSLAARLRDLVETQGPIPFHRFMELALTDPDGGYYTSARARPTRAGDYLTAPELHPIFGHCLAHQIIEVWDRLGRPTPFILREYGAGAGTLAEAVIEEIRRSAPILLDGLRYEPIEISHHRLAELRVRFEANGLSDKLLEAGGAIAHGVVLANEYLDALPVHRVIRRGEVLRERYVGWANERFVELEGPLSDPGLAAALARLGVVAPDVVVEIRPGVARWLADVRADLETGVVLVIDYGAPTEHLFGPLRPDGTLVAYRAHRVAGRPLDDPGEQDLTAHVDFGDLERWARELGFEVLGTTSQAAFLIGCGLEDLLRREQLRPTATLQDLLTLRSAVRRLLDPRALGGFRVAVLGLGIAADPPLRGLSIDLPARGPMPRER